MRSFGLIGYPLGHSFSKGYFTARFEKEGIAAVYNNYPLSNIEELPSLLQREGALEGLNVTIPYKEQVMRYLHTASPVVQQIGACNCIRIREGQLSGFNTDVVGFEHSLLEQLKSHHDTALVFGTGGAAKAVIYVLQKLRIPYAVVSRKADPQKGILAYDELRTEQLADARLWINTTPLGMHPNVNEAPPLDYSCIGREHYLYDLVYNPAETRFLAMGNAAGAVTKNGYDMLILQAEESWRIWNE